MGTLYLCAAGNPDGVRLAIEVNEVEQRWDQIVILDDDPSKLGVEIMGVPVVGPFSKLSDHKAGDEAVNLVARSTKVRDRVRAIIEDFGISLVSLVHPTVDIRGATIGRAVTVYAGCTVSALSTVGDHSVVFTQAVLGHGASLGNGAVIAPGGVVNARVQVGDRAYIGSNASVLPDLTVGKDATVSACSAAIGDIPEGATALGVPAEVMGGSSIMPTQDADTQAIASDLSSVFGVVLGVQAYSNDMNFFEAGGNSKQALDVRQAIQDKLGFSISVVDMFRCPSPALMASHLGGSANGSIHQSRAAMRKRRSRARP